MKGASGSSSQSGGGSPKEPMSQSSIAAVSGITSTNAISSSVAAAGSSSPTDLRVPPILPAGLSSTGLPSTLMGSSQSGVWPPAQAAAAMVVLGQNLTLQQLTALHSGGRNATATSQTPTSAAAASTPSQVCSNNSDIYIYI